jgi:cellulose synthase/poly-beta-1,6-N-acetylglucosamine synthase-like glycosyltransferase
MRVRGSVSERREHQPISFVKMYKEVCDTSARSGYELQSSSYLFIQNILSPQDCLNIIQQHVLYRFKKKCIIKKIKHHPSSVAIIIPSYNKENENQKKCVRSAFDQDYLHPFQVILVDTGKKNFIRKILEKFIDQERFELSASKKK